MELQLALDFITTEKAIAVLNEVGDGIDIVEVGTPFVIDEGLHAVRRIRQAFPALKILADLKIMDAGEHETIAAIDAGANIVTVLGVANIVTIKAAVETAKKKGGEIMIDLMDVPDMEKRIPELDALGVDYFCVHTSVDAQAVGGNPLADLRMAKRIVKNARIAVAGGIKQSTVKTIAAEKPDILIVGGGITGQADKRAAALALKKAICE